MLPLAVSDAQVFSRLPQLERGINFGPLQPELSLSGLAPTLPNGDPYVRTNKAELTLPLIYSGTRFPHVSARLSDYANNNADLTQFVLQQAPANNKAV